MEELDYQKTVENLQKIVSKMFSNEQRYFELLTKLNELSKYNTISGENITSMSIIDQIKIFEVAVKLAEVQKSLCEKYGFTDGDIE